MRYRRLLKDLLQLRSNTMKSKEQIKNLQTEKLHHILHYAYEHSIYYHQLFEEAGITADNIDTVSMTSFPVLTKELLLQHFDEIVTVPDLKQKDLVQFDETNDISKKAYLDKYHLVHSSGSTGTPRYFVYDESAWNQMLLGIVRGALWGMSLWKMAALLCRRPRILYIAATDGRYDGAMAVGDGIDGVGARQMFLDINTPLTEWKAKINSFHPNMVIGYPSAVKILAELAEEDGIHEKFVRIITCGEPLSMGLRKYLETMFHTTIINFYGASESLAIGAEERISEGMFLFDDMNYIETVDGQMYLTSLYNEVQPLIRYHISDQIVWKTNEILSNCTFSRIESPLGRDEDLIWFQDTYGNKEFLHPLSVEGLCVSGVIDYQFQQTAEDAFEMLVEIEDGHSTEKIQSESFQMMQEILNQKGLYYVRFVIHFVEQIMINPETGKKQLIVQMDEERESYGN